MITWWIALIISLAVAYVAASLGCVFGFILYALMAINHVADGDTARALLAELCHRIECGTWPEVEAWAKSCDDWLNRVAA